MPHSTSTYGLPYPEPGDSPDVPRDFKALADRLESVLPALKAEITSAINEASTALLLPAPVSKALTAQHSVPQGAVGSDGTASRIGSALTFTNSGKFKLLVKVAQEGWGLIYGDKYDKTFSMYAEPEASGGTFVSSNQARGDSYNVPGAATKNLRYYEDMDSWVIKVLDPGRTLTAYARCWLSSGIASAERTAIDPQFRNGTLSIVPMGWVQTPGVLAVEPVFSVDTDDTGVG